MAECLLWKQFPTVSFQVQHSLIWSVLVALFSWVACRHRETCEVSWISQTGQRTYDSSCATAWLQRGLTWNVTATPASSEWNNLLNCKKLYVLLRLYLVLIHFFQVCLRIHQYVEHKTQHSEPTSLGFKCDWPLPDPCLLCKLCLMYILVCVCYFWD